MGTLTGQTSSFLEKLETVLRTDARGVGSEREGRIEHSPAIWGAKKFCRGERNFALDSGVRKIIFLNC